MKKVTGKVEAVSTKPLDQEDKYGNTHRASIKLDDGNWYSMGSLKSNVLTVQDDNKKWQPLGVGSEVLIKYEENGNFRNSSRGQMTILDLVVGERESSSKPAPAQSTSTSKPSTTYGGTNWAEKDAGIQAGHAVNGAIQILKENLNGNLNGDKVLQVAREIHAITRQLQKEILDPPSVPDPPSPGPPSPASKKPAAKSKKEPAELPADWEDEELPF